MTVERRGGNGVDACQIERPGNPRLAARITAIEYDHRS